LGSARGRVSAVMGGNRRETLLQVRLRNAVTAVTSQTKRAARKPPLAQKKAPRERGLGGGAKKRARAGGQESSALMPQTGPEPHRSVTRKQKGRPKPPKLRNCRDQRQPPSRLLDRPAYAANRFPPSRRPLLTVKTRSNISYLTSRKPLTQPHGCRACGGNWSDLTIWPTAIGSQRAPGSGRSTERRD
jgi:hypothetical protein